MFQRLIYFSARSAQCDGDISNLVKRAAVNNRAGGITGLLIADANVFLQVLEGPRNEVSALFQRICNDPRHERIVLASVESIAAPAYPDWGMNQIGDTGRVVNLWRSANPNLVFDPWAMSAEAVRDFMRLATFELMSLRQTA